MPLDVPMFRPRFVPHPRSWVPAANSAGYADPRTGQILILLTLAVYGSFRLDLEVSFLQGLVAVGAAQATQWLGSRHQGRPFDPLSALISALSLTLLLRTNHLAWVATAAILAVGSKFVFRVGGRHIFNPTNFALVALLAITPDVWVSAGQWGASILGASALACAGVAVSSHSSRADVPFAYLACYGTILIARAFWLGDPWAVPWHQLQSGSLLIFAFFMISDPKTTPDSRSARIFHAGLVAGVAAFIQFGLHRPHGALWGLALLAPALPLLNRLLPNSPFQWPGHRDASPDPLPGGSA